MTQEGQALPSPTPPETPVEPDAPTSSTTDPPAGTHSQVEQDKPGAEDTIEEGKQEEEIREGEDEAQRETQREGEGREEVKDEGGEGELKEEKVDGDPRADGGAERTSGGVRMNVEVSSAGEEGREEEEERKESEERQRPTEEEETQAGRLVH